MKCNLSLRERHEIEGVSTLCWQVNLKKLQSKTAAELDALDSSRLARAFHCES